MIRKPNKNYDLQEITTRKVLVCRKQHGNSIAFLIKNNVTICDELVLAMTLGIDTEEISNEEKFIARLGVKKALNIIRDVLANNQDAL